MVTAPMDIPAPAERKKGRGATASVSSGDDELLSEMGLLRGRQMRGVGGGIGGVGQGSGESSAGSEAMDGGVLGRSLSVDREGGEAFRSVLGSMDSQSPGGEVELFGRFDESFPRSGVGRRITGGERGGTADLFSASAPSGVAIPAPDASTKVFAASKAASEKAPEAIASSQGGNGIEQQGNGSARA